MSARPRLRIDFEGLAPAQQLPWLDAARHFFELPLTAQAHDKACELHLTVMGDPALIGPQFSAPQRHEDKASRFMVCLLPPQPLDCQRLLRAGVQDILINSEPTPVFRQLQAYQQARSSDQGLLSSPLIQNNLPGQAPRWRQFILELIHAAKSPSIPLLLEGPSGTGKELAARLVHTLDPRPEKAKLITVDATTLSSELAASTLFGHEKGAFTGASGSRQGAALQADHGTLFLDEVGELSLPVQAQLLRLLQEGQFQALGSDRWQRTDFRLICATHRPLKQMVRQGLFRADLYYRLTGLQIPVPGLRDRPEDIVLLAQHFLAEFGCNWPLDDVCKASLNQHPFEGNVRELKQLMRNVAARHIGTGPITLGCFPRYWLEQADGLMSGSDLSVPDDSLPLPQADESDLPEDYAIGVHAPIEAACATSPQASLSDAGAPAARIAQPLLRHWIEVGLSLKDIIHQTSALAIRTALELEQNHVGRAAKRLQVTPRAIQMRRAAQRETRVGARA